MTCRIRLPYCLIKENDLQEAMSPDHRASKVLVIQKWSVARQTLVGFEDVLKTSSRHVFKTSSTRLHCNNFWSSKTSWRCLEDVLKTSCKDVLKTTWRRLEDISQDVFKTSWKTKNCYAEDVFKTCLQDVLKTCLQDIFKTSWKQKNGDICI